MNTSPTNTDDVRFDLKGVVAGVLIVGLILALFWDGLVYMVEMWEKREEYNHGFLIPFVAFYLLWLNARHFGQVERSGTWLGLIIILLGIAGLFLGELSSIFVIIQYSCLFTLLGVIIASAGWSGFRAVQVPFYYLLFMIPLPVFLRVGLSSELQLISSEIGVAFIRLVGISVFLEGNVIDLGVYQLQVAEACSGLRYLFPLMSFGFLCGALYNGPFWHKAVVFISTVPITILMNSFRVGVIGVLVNAYGIEQAEGFLHFFEGWIVFMACVGLLFLEMFLLNKLQPGDKSFMEVFGLDVPPASDLLNLLPRRIAAPVVPSIIVLLASLVALNSFQDREVKIPDRQRLALFPMKVGEWIGQDMPVDDMTLDALKVDDYLLANYQQGEAGPMLDLWIAYYGNQRKGESVHSPRTCLPGGGWTMETFDQTTVASAGPGGEPLVVNRSLISKGDNLQVVYYWFEQRGRKLTNEYMVKWYIFWDALMENRSDGALVRITTFANGRDQVDEAEERLQSFIREVNPTLAYYLPQESAVFRQAQAAR